MKLKALRQLTGDYGNVGPDQEFECSDKVAASLLSRGLAEVVHDVKMAPTHENKMEPPLENKAEVTAEPKQQRSKPKRQTKRVTRRKRK